MKKAVFIAMKIIKNITDLTAFISKTKALNKRIGFVPTMGSLHDGHLSLIGIAKINSDVVVASIFVNPTQFNDSNDFDLYPRNPVADTELLKANGCDVLFLPDVKTMYPNGVKSKNYAIGNLGKIMESNFRPGHFNGVIEVVKRLLDMVQPDVAVFGNKDFQQLVVIRWMVNYFNLDIDIIGAPIVREKDGLAMSSRNKRLNAKERKTALTLSEILFFIRDNYKKFQLTQLKNNALGRLKKTEGLELEYLEFADSTTLMPVSEYKNDSGTCVFIAAKIGNVRLIDNVVLF